MFYSCFLLYHRARDGEPASLRQTASVSNRHAPTRQARPASRLATDRAIEEGEEVVEVEGLCEGRGSQSFQIRGAFAQ